MKLNVINVNAHLNKLKISEQSNLISELLAMFPHLKSIESEHYGYCPIHIIKSIRKDNIILNMGSKYIRPMSDLV